MRWPRLAEYLEEYPDMMDEIGKQNTTGIPEEFQALLKDNDVLKVIQWKPSNVSLDAKIARQCALIHA
jgi:hypothetical protein